MKKGKNHFRSPHPHPLPIYNYNYKNIIQIKITMAAMTEAEMGEVMSVSFSPDGQSVVSGSFDKTIRLWSVESGELLRTMEGH